MTVKLRCEFPGDEGGSRVTDAPEVRPDRREDIVVRSPFSLSALEYTDMTSLALVAAERRGRPDMTFALAEESGLNKLGEVTCSNQVVEVH